MRKREPASPYYPVLLNIRNRKCLIVGGGQVALRKVQTLLDHAAEVEVISPTLCPELSRLARDGAIRAHQRTHSADDLQNTFLAIAATDNARVNESVASESKRRGVLVNIVDDPKNSDFIVPSQFSHGDIVVAVSTSGRSPALARKIRSELEKGFKTEYAQLAVLADEIRAELRQKGIMASGDVWQEVLNLNSIVELIKRGKNKEAKEIMFSRLKTLGRKEH